MQMRKGVWVVAVWMLLCRPVTAQDDAAFDRWRHLDAQTQIQILTLARRTFDTYIQQRKVIAPPTPLPAPLGQHIGIFVSAMRNGAPRCCMGTIYPTQPNAALEIIENAVTAAGRDRRFAPISVREARSLILIVSIVGKPVPITQTDLTRMDPTRDGLVVRSGDRYGVVLSGETDQVERMLHWGRVRAGVRANSAVELFRLPVVRFVEKRSGPHPQPLSQFWERGGIRVRVREDDWPQATERRRLRRMSEVRRVRCVPGGDRRK